MIRRGASLPLRLWLVLALLAIAGTPTLVTVGASRLLDHWQAQADQDRMASVRRIVGTDAGQWRAPAWQRGATAALASLGADLRLVDDRGFELFVTPGARKILSTIGPWTAAHPSIAFLKLAITSNGPVPGGQARAGGAKGSPSPPIVVLGTAAIWLSGPAAGAPPAWAVPACAAVALLLVLVLVSWFLRRAVLQPLAAMSRATEQIAGGDLDISLPSSRAREVAAVAAGLAAMSSALGEALGRQAAQEEERRLFVSAIAHDLRTPLFMLRGYLQGLENGVAATPEKIAAYVRACAERADTLERLIADLFDYSRLEYMDSAPRRERLELGAVLRQAVEEALPAAAAKGVRLLARPACQACPCIGDGPLLGRAVRNLLDNALCYTPPGGMVQVCWAREGSMLRLAVEDTGCGIAPHDLPHLFDPLYRAEASRNRHTGGAGLGLTIARRIILAHGGELTAANRAEGGAVFTAAIPVEAAADSRPAM